MRIGFRFRWIPFMATVLMVALGISLAQWQERRAAEKMAQEAQQAAGNSAAPVILGPQPLAVAAVEFRRVLVTGQFVPDWAMYLENRPYRGRAGFYLLMPFKIAGSSMHVLVERGWLPRNAAERERMATYATPRGMVTIEGIAKRNVGHVMQLGVAAPLRPNAIVQNADIAQVARACGLPFQPFVLEQTSMAAQGDAQLVRDWPAPSAGADKHRAYAFQWYALALMAFLFFVFTGYRRATN